MKVWVEVPEFWGELLERAARMEGWSKRTDYLRELIKNDLKAKGLLGKPGNGDKEVVVGV